MRKDYALERKDGQKSCYATHKVCVGVVYDKVWLQKHNSKARQQITQSQIPYKPLVNFELVKNSNTNNEPIENKAY